MPGNTRLSNRRFMSRCSSLIKAKGWRVTRFMLALLGCQGGCSSPRGRSVALHARNRVGCRNFKSRAASSGAHLLYSLRNAVAVLVPGGDSARSVASATIPALIHARRRSGSSASGGCGSVSGTPIPKSSEGDCNDDQSGRHHSNLYLEDPGRKTVRYHHVADIRRQESRLVCGAG